MASKYDGLARIIIQNVGGRDNIAGLTEREGIPNSMSANGAGRLIRWVFGSR